MDNQFKPSKNLSLGVEIEIQIINKYNYDLMGVAEDLLQQLDFDSSINIKPEMTQSMLEINSSIHQSTNDLLDELKQIRKYLKTKFKDLPICIMGGGTHPFQMWNERKIYPDPKFINAAKKYGYLAKLFTVFGLHIHVGCLTGDDAIYLTQALANFIPQFIALSASSPFSQGIDTHFDSSRSTVVNSFPLSGLMPTTISTWNDFDIYLNEMRELKIVENVDNFYWDIRPRADFGTVEIRVCDSPLTLEKVALLVAYLQTIAQYILVEKPFNIIPDETYQLHKYNRFQASKYGYSAKIINLQTHQHSLISDEILNTCKQIKVYAKHLGNQKLIEEIALMAETKQNDTRWLRDLKHEGLSLNEIVLQQSILWNDDP